MSQISEKLSVRLSSILTLVASKYFSLAISTSLSKSYFDLKFFAMSFNFSWNLVTLCTMQELYLYLAIGSFHLRHALFASQSRVFTNNIGVNTFTGERCHSQDVPETNFLDSTHSPFCTEITLNHVATRLSKDLKYSSTPLAKLGPFIQKTYFGISSSSPPVSAKNSFFAVS